MGRFIGCCVLILKSMGRVLDVVLCNIKLYKSRWVGYIFILQVVALLCSKFFLLALVHVTATGDPEVGVVSLIYLSFFSKICISNFARHTILKLFSNRFPSDFESFERNEHALHHLNALQNFITVWNLILIRLPRSLSLILTQWGDFFINLTCVYGVNPRFVILPSYINMPYGLVGNSTRYVPN